MPVRNEPLVNGNPEQTRHRIPAVVSKNATVGAMIVLLRIIALLLIAISTLGNYVQFVGGWDHYVPINWQLIGLALFYQVICSLLQWGFKSAGWWFPYLVALAASAVPSFLTYNALFGPYMALQVGAIPALLVIVIAVVGGDALPEWVLVA